MNLSSTNVLSLPDGEKFDGLIGLCSWKTKITTIAKARGYLVYLDSSLPKPPTPTVTAGNPALVPLPPDPMPVYSQNPSFEEWEYHDASTFVLVVLNVKNPDSLGMKLDGTAAKAFASLIMNYEHITDMG
ncbi:hypothetical protein B0H17DRAFT_942599 [Mycena rosella]|uniref:Uncharacterized protein n=1 Tax=Mycena rosella TaxID=1033263 RepID=A0AAD7D7H0_MYCRO|nr:hypothetical protein B0H17DRAFT_942599 [Mycena rosella]